MLPIPPLASARLLTASALTATALVGLAQPVGATALFNAVDVDQSKFVLVAAPIGDGSRAQLNIYEQRRATRPCYAVQPGTPAVVDPLLATFDFTGICNRFIDTNGYSLRVGGTDLATVYRLSVLRSGNDTILLATPGKAGAGPEMVVARTGGTAAGFLQLVPEPGWRLMRRHFGSRALGHVYLYRDDWPAGTPTAASSPAPASAPAPSSASSTPAASTTPAPAPGPAPTAAPAAALPPLPAVSPAPAGAAKPGRPTAL